jgi:hypothetical protein
MSLKMENEGRVGQTVLVLALTEGSSDLISEQRLYPRRVRHDTLKLV